MVVQIQNSSSLEYQIILLKLFLELNFALIATKIHFLVDNSIIIKRVSSFSSKKFVKGNEFIKVKLKYIMGNGIESIQTEYL